MLNRLRNRNNDFFVPSLHGCLQKNSAIQLDNKQIYHIRKKAFEEGILLKILGTKLLDRVFSAGICSGLSAFSLLRFAAIEEINDKQKLYPFVFQARTLSGTFIKKCVTAYFNSSKNILEELASRIKSSDFLEWPLLILLPKIHNLSKIDKSHTVIPYSFETLWTKIIIKVYDSNFPKDDNKVLIYDKLKNNWSYEDYISQNWIIAVINLKRLYEKGYFLLR